MTEGANPFPKEILDLCCKKGDGLGLPWERCWMEAATSIMTGKPPFFIRRERRQEAVERGNEGET